MSKISNTKQNRIKIKRLLNKGLSIELLSKLNEGGMNMLHTMVIKEEEPKTAEELSKDHLALSTAYSEISKKEEEMGDLEENFPDASVDGKKLKKDVNGKKDVIDENDLEEGYDEDTIHPGEGEVTQDPHQVGPDTDDGFGNPKEDDDGMGMFEGVTKQHLIEKFASKAQARYFYAKSNEPGKEGKKWKKYTKEFSDDTEDFDTLPEKVEQDESIENTNPKLVENENQYELLGKLKDITATIKALRKASSEECVKMARKCFEDVHHDQIANLLYNFPLDHVNKET